MIRSLLLLCALFATVITAELMAYADPGRPDLAPEARPAASKPVAGPVSQDVAGGTNWLTPVLGRPLFAPDRRPQTGFVSRDPSLPRLAGIISVPEGTVAIFQPEGDGKPVLTHAGERVAGWRVTTIGSGSVDLEKAGQRVVLTPRFAPASSPTPLMPGMGPGRR